MIWTCVTLASTVSTDVSQCCPTELPQAYLGPQYGWRSKLPHRKPLRSDLISRGRIEILPTGPGTSNDQSNQRGSFQTFCLRQILSWVPCTPTFQHPWNLTVGLGHPFLGPIYTWASSTMLTLSYHVVFTNTFTWFFD